jgi:sodium pump decarboxylase gamma subunit
MHFEGLSGAVNVSIVAFSIVFGVLFVLTMVIFGMKLFAGSGTEKKNDTVTPKPATSASTASVSKASGSDKAKIVAAITAAIIEFSGSQNFRILSIEADKGRDYWTSRWKTAGMINLNSNRLNRAWN